MANTNIQQLEVSLPGAGNTQTYHLDADTPVKFEFDLANAVFSGTDGNLQITVEGGGTVVLENYQALADSDGLPLFEMVNGEQVAGDVYIFAFDGVDQNADVETAAGNNTGSSGAGQYNDDPGTLFAGIEALGGQGDAYGTHVFPVLTGVLGDNVPPTANDDAASVTEAGDPDVIVGRHIVFVDSAEDYAAALAHASEGGPAIGDYFPLSSGGGFYIQYPNPPQLDETIQGNVIDNDVDPDGDHDQLAMVTMDYVGTNHDGVDPDPVPITSDDATIVGRYGILTISADGHWEYTLNQTWADAMNEGDHYDEVFQYTITDAEGGESNTATLTITVNGANDMPVAHDDLNVQAVETGDSTDHALHASVHDGDLNGEGGQVTVHDSDHYDYTSNGNVLVHGNVLAGDDAGSVSDTDVDAGDSPDGQTMFVVGVYSHATETMDSILPDEQNPDFTPTADQAYDQAAMDPTASVTVNGEFGVLTIHADGSYDYRLYTPEDGDAYNALNALNYGSEDNVDAFSYGIMDDSGAFSYANISFTVNGANDAPTANADVNNVTEFGLRFAGDADYSAVVTGNVVAGDENGGVADDDADDSLMYVSTVSSQTGDSDTLYTDDNMDPNGTVTINGEYGILTIHADGTYSYALQNDWDNVQALNENDARTDVFTYTLTNAYDDGVYSEPTTLTINVSGANDAPTALADANHFVESADTEAAVSVTGNLLAGDEHGGVADTDVDNVLADFTVTGVTSDNTTNTATPDTDGYDFVLKGEYGTLYLNEDGSYKYVEDPDATNWMNNDTTPVTDVFTYTMSDNEGTNTGHASSTLTITINGANDAPTAMADANSLTESVDGGDASFTTGNLLAGDEHGGVADTDHDNVLSDFTVTGVTSDNTTNTAVADTDGYDFVLKGEYGTLYLNEDGSYKYVEDPAATETLNVGDHPTDVFTYTMSDNQDGDPKGSSSTLTVTINGANDAPTIDLSMGTVEFVSENAAYNNMVGVYQVDENGNPIHAEIILANSNHASEGDLLATFEDGQQPHYFLVDVEYGATPTGTPEFILNTATGQWEVSFDGGTTTYAVRFDDAAINGDPEATFQIEDLTDGRMISLDDQMKAGYKTPGDDDDFDDTIMREHTNPGTGFENTFTEDGGPVHITGEVNISDVDSANMSQAVITLTNAQDGDSLNIDTGALPSGITATVNGTEIILSGDASISDYESAIELITFNNGSDDPDTADRLIDVRVWDDGADPTGAPSNVATATIHVVAVENNTPPVAVDDTGTGTSTGDVEGTSVIPGSDHYTLVAQEYDSQSGDWISADLTQWGNGHGAHYGVGSADDGAGKDQFIENDGSAERLLVQFDDPQESVSLKFTADGSGQDSIQAWDAEGNPITDLTFGHSGDIVTVSSPTTDIATVVIMADPDDPDASVALKEVAGSTPADISSVVFAAAVVTGNVLANDHDAQDTDYTDGPGYPDGSTELTVTGAAAGDLDDLTQAEYDQHLANGDFDGASGTTFDLDDDGVGATIHGQYGDLVIAEDGSYTYTTHDGLAVGDYTESFTYQVSDSDGAVDYGVLEVTATIDNPVLTAENDLGHGAWVTNTLQTNYQWVDGTGQSDINFTNQNAGNPNEWSTLADHLGLKVTATNFAGHKTPVSEFDKGIGVDSKGRENTSELQHEGDSSETMTLTFGQDHHDLPHGLYLMINDVDTGEHVIFTITDSNGHTFTVDTGSATGGTSFTDGSGTGLTLMKMNNNQYTITGSHEDADGNGGLYIQSVTLSAGAGASFSLNYINLEVGGQWIPAGTTGEQSVQAVSGYLLDNDYSSDNAAMTAAIVGSGVGAWGTLEITDAATGAWTYTPNASAVFDETSGLNGPAVEQFTYQVTDAHGLTDTATLYVPVHYNATVGDHGTDGADVIYGSDGEDSLLGLGGDDFLYGEGGNDTIHGGDGHDYLSGGDGNDHLYGGDGNDYLFGGNGDDVLHGGAGNDHLFGGSGDDSLWGGSGNDVIDAGSGDDTVFVSSGHDTVTLGAGADTITVDPSYLTNGDGGGSMTVTDFNIHEGDTLDLSSLSSGVVDVTSTGDSGDLVLTIADVNPAGDDITITLQGVLPPTHDAVDHHVDLSATGDDLNAVVQHIINSGGHTS